jgi:hypothetical protein
MVFVKVVPLLRLMGDNVGEVSLNMTRNVLLLMVSMVQVLRSVEEA